MHKRLFFGIALILALLIQPTSYFAAGQENSPARAGKSPEDEKKPQPQVEKKEKGPITAESRVILVQGIALERAKSRMRLPGGNSKKGVCLTIYFDKASGKYVARLDEKQLSQEITKNGSSIIPDDDVLITFFEIKEKDRTIEMVLNGGLKNKKKVSWIKEHVSFGGGPPRGNMPRIETQTTTTGPNDKPDLKVKPGSMVSIDFPNGIPDLTPDELKELLAVVLDFSHQTSAAVQEVDKWPDNIRLAVSEGRVVVGMNADQVRAALKQSGYGDYQPSQERNAEGRMTKTWIFGTPPLDILMLIFDDEPGETYGKVVCVKEEPNILECKQTSRPHAATVDH